MTRTVSHLIVTLNATPQPAWRMACARALMRLSHLIERAAVAVAVPKVTVQ